MTASAPRPLLQATGLWKSFGDREVLRGIDLELAQHEVVALIGASGSGKSTLLRCLNLLEPIDDGQIWLGDLDISDPRVDGNRVRARLGAVFQSYNLFPHLSVLDNVTLASRVVHRMPRAQAEARAREATKQANTHRQQAQSEAEALLARARREAEQIVASARPQADAIATSGDAEHERNVAAPKAEEDRTPQRGGGLRPPPPRGSPGGRRARRLTCRGGSSGARRRRRRAHWGPAPR